MFNSYFPTHQLNMWSNVFSRPTDTLSSTPTRSFLLLSEVIRTRLCIEALSGVHDILALACNAGGMERPLFPVFVVVVGGYRGQQQHGKRRPRSLRMIRIISLGHRRTHARAHAHIRLRRCTASHPGLSSRHSSTRALQRAKPKTAQNSKQRVPKTQYPPAPQMASEQP